MVYVVVCVRVCVCACVRCMCVCKRVRACVHVGTCVRSGVYVCVCVGWRRGVRMNGLRLGLSMVVCLDEFV